jgi:hypothetical protein
VKYLGVQTSSGRVGALSAALLICALVVSSARASIIDHSGSAQPDTDEGWNLGVYYGGSDAYPVTNDFGENAWGIEKTGESQELVYTYNLSNDQLDAVANLGWSVNVRLRVVNTNDDPDFAISVHFGVGATRYDMNFGSTAGGNPIVMLVNSFTGNGINPTGSTYTVTGDGYHDYKLVYDPFAGNADLFVDGIERISNYTGSANQNGVPNVFFGAAGSQGTGRAYFSQLSVAVPEPSGLSLLWIGACAVLRRRRR